MKLPVTCAVATSFAVALTASLQAGDAYTEPAPMVAPPSDASCPWGVAAEALFLKAHETGDEFDNQDEEFGYRLEFSYKNGDALGYRLRYFDWEGSEPYESEDYRDENPEASALDLEVFQDFTLGIIKLVVNLVTVLTLLVFRTKRNSF